MAGLPYERDCSAVRDVRIELERMQFTCEVMHHLAIACTVGGVLEGLALTAKEAEQLLTVLAQARGAIERHAPEYAQPRLLEGLNAMAETIAWRSGASIFGDERTVADRRDRLRIARNEADTLSLIADLKSGHVQDREERLMRIAENEADSVRIEVRFARRANVQEISI